MTDLHLDATSRTPAITLDQKGQMLVIAGESYPEDVSGFYAALTAALEGYFAGGAESLTVHIKLTYFNSSSARALMELLDILDDAAERDASVTVQWFCDPDDDITREFAEDIAAEVTHASVTILDLDVEQD
jgi:hypothetical protein